MPQRPNIVMIVGEDTGRLLGCYGHSAARTPNLDRLAAEGCRFDQAVSTAPVCAPSRATMITGQYPWKIGTHQMRSTLLNPPRLFTQELREAGYYVSWPTKLDFNFDPEEGTSPDDPAGWRNDKEDWRDRLRNGHLRAPFFLFYNIGITHESAIWPAEAPPGRPGGMGAGKNITRVTDPADVTVPPYLPDTPTVRNDIARHFDNVHELDRQLGELLEALDASGERDNTVVLFLADHGRGLVREKRWPYSAGVHMPLLVRWPGKIAAGSTSDRLVSWTDLAQTFCHLAGATPNPDYDGIPFLSSDGIAMDEGHAVVFSGRDRMDEAFDRLRTARDRRYHYVRNFYPEIPYAQYITYMNWSPTTREMRRLHAEGKLRGDAAVFFAEAKPAEELYDLTADYHCVHNLADDPAHAVGKAKLSAAMDEMLAAVGDKGATPEAELVRQGLLADRIPEYQTRIDNQPAAWKAGPFRTSVTAKR
ncbi:MAG: sulfatase [Phycisphaerae bacterium]